MTTTNWTVLDRAHADLRAAALGVPVDGWDARTPCTEWTVTQVLQHAVGDQIGYTAALTGGPGPDEDPFAPSGRRPADPIDYVDQALRASAAAWSAVGPEATDVPTPLPQGALPAATAAGACALDAAVHAWDIAVATGQPVRLDETLANALLPVARGLVEPLRQYGAYAAAGTPQPGDGAVETLLRFLGRDPHWSA